MSAFIHHEMVPLGADDTSYRSLTTEHVSQIDAGGRSILKIEPAALTLLTAQAFEDSAHLLRTRHLQQLAGILEDPEASDNDRYVAYELLKNANIAAGRILPMCQDTGTAIIMGKKGEAVWVDGNDEAAISAGVMQTYTQSHLRYSQMAPLSMYEEVNTGSNLPAQIELYADKGNAYKFLFVAKGGGSANKAFLFQQTRALLNPDSMMSFLEEKVKTLGTAACPPYHLAVVIGGPSAEFTMKMVKLASCRYLDTLPTSGNEHGQAFRDLAFEEKLLEIAREGLGIGAQFGGKYLLPSMPGSSVCLVTGPPSRWVIARLLLGRSPDTQGEDHVKDGRLPGKTGARIRDASFPRNTRGLEAWQGPRGGGSRPGRWRPSLRHPRSKYIRIRTAALADRDPSIVARDIAHAKLKERIDAGDGLPDYVKDHCIYYAGPAKTPEGYASGSFGPTTAGRMDSYVDLLQSHGASMVMLAKGNRSRQVTEACRAHGGFYLGSIGGPAARLAQDCITGVECVEYPELGMEAIWRIEVRNFPAFIVVDDKGNDFFAEFSTAPEG